MSLYVELSHAVLWSQLGFKRNAVCKLRKGWLDHFDGGFNSRLRGMQWPDVLIPNMVIRRIMLRGSQNGRSVSAGYFQVRLMISEGAAILELECLEVVGCRSVQIVFKGFRRVLDSVCRGVVAGHGHGHFRV